MRKNLNLICEYSNLKKNKPFCYVLTDFTWLLCIIEALYASLLHFIAIVFRLTWNEHRDNLYGERFDFGH